MAYFAEAVKCAVEEDKDCSTRHFRDVVQRLTGIVTDPCIRVVETGQYRLNQFRQMHSYARLSVQDRREVE